MKSIIRKLRQLSPISLSLLALLLYGISTIYITYPLFFNLGLLSYGLGDELLIAYIHAWVSHSLQTDIFSLFNANIYFPYTNSLAYSDVFLTTGILSSMSWILVKQPIATLNTIILLSFFSVGFGLFLLAFHVSKNFWASFISGLLVIFSPVFIEKSVHVQILFLPFVLFSIYFYILFLEKEKIRYFVLFLLCFVSQLYISFLPGYFILFTILIITVVKIYTEKLLLRVLINKKTIITTVITITLLVPVVVPYYQVSKEFNYVRDIRDTIHFALQPEDLVYPNVHTRLSPILSHVLPPPETAPVGEVKSGYLGFVFSMLCIGSVIYLVKKYKSINTFVISFTITGILGLLLSFGPFLHLGRQTIHHPFPIPLPYLLCYYLLPGFQGFRNSARFEILFVIAFAIVIALVLTDFLKKKKAFTRTVVYGICILGIVAEFSFPIHYVTVPQVKDFPAVYSYINTLPKDVVILEMPIFVWNMQPYVFAENYREYYSTVHFRKMVNGASGFSPPPWQKMVTELLKTFPEESSITKLKQIGVTHVIFHKVEYDQLAKDGFKVEGNAIKNGEEMLKTLEENEQISLQRKFGNDYVFKLK